MSTELTVWTVVIETTTTVRRQGQIVKSKSMPEAAVYAVGKSFQTSHWLFASKAA
jgi:hypothetical protein